MSYSDNELRAVHKTVITIAVTVAVTIVLLALTIFIYKDSQAGKRVNEACIANHGDGKKYDIKYDGLRPREGCMF